MEITYKQKKLVMEILVGNSVKGASANIGISEATAYSYLKEPTVKKFLREEVSKLYTEAFLFLSGLVSESLIELQLILRHGQERNKLDAIKIILDNSEKFRTFDLDERVSQIEKKINENVQTTLICSVNAGEPDIT